MDIKTKRFILKEKVDICCSKSYLQRILICLLLSKKDKIRIKNFNTTYFSGDILTTLSVLEYFGYKQKFEKSSTIIYRDRSCVSPPPSYQDLEINCDESGFLARVLPLALSFINSEFRIKGNKRLLGRGIIEDYKYFQKRGWEIKYLKKEFDIKFSGAVLNSGKYNFINPKSSQLITGLLMCLPLVNGDSEICIENAVSASYIDLTISVMLNFGIKIKVIKDVNNKLIIRIKGNQEYKIKTSKVEGDWSSASFLIVAAALNEGISILGLEPQSLQADKKILELDCIKHRWLRNSLFSSSKKLKISSNASISSNSNTNKPDKGVVQKRGFVFDATHCPDLIPALTVLAMFSGGSCKIYGTDRLKYKESSRAEVLQTEFSKIGAKIFLNEDHLQIFSKKNYNTAILDSHNDHRIAMAAFIAGLKIEGGVEIKNFGCIKKSYPYFLDCFEIKND